MLLRLLRFVQLSGSVYVYGICVGFMKLEPTLWSTDSNQGHEISVLAKLHAARLEVEQLITAATASHLLFP